MLFAIFGEERQKGVLCRDGGGACLVASWLFHHPTFAWLATHSHNTGARVDEQEKKDEEEQKQHNPHVPVGRIGILHARRPLPPSVNVCCCVFVCVRVCMFRGNQATSNGGRKEIKISHCPSQKSFDLGLDAICVHFLITNYRRALGTALTQSR